MRSGYDVPATLLQWSVWPIKHKNWDDRHLEKGCQAIKKGTELRVFPHLCVARTKEYRLAFVHPDTAKPSIQNMYYKEESPCVNSNNLRFNQKKVVGLENGVVHAITCQAIIPCSWLHCLINQGCQSRKWLQWIRHYLPQISNSHRSSRKTFISIEVWVSDSCLSQILQLGHSLHGFEDGDQITGAGTPLRKVQAMTHGIVGGEKFGKRRCRLLRRNVPTGSHDFQHWTRPNNSNMRLHTSRSLEKRFFCTLIDNEYDDDNTDSRDIR